MDSSPGIVARRRCASFILEDTPGLLRSSPSSPGRASKNAGLSPRSPLTPLTNNNSPRDSPSKASPISIKSIAKEGPGSGTKNLRRKSLLNRRFSSASEPGASNIAVKIDDDASPTQCGNVVVESVNAANPASATKAADSNDCSNGSSSSALSNASSGAKSPASPRRRSPAIPRRMKNVSPADVANLRNILARSPFSANKKNNFAVPASKVASLRRNLLRKQFSQQTSTPQETRNHERHQQSSHEQNKMDLKQNQDAEQVKRSPLQWKSPSLRRVLHSPDLTNSASSTPDSVGARTSRCSMPSSSPLFDSVSPVLEDPRRIVCDRLVKSNSHTDTPSPTASARIAHSLSADSVLSSFKSLPNFGFEMDPNLSPEEHKSFMTEIVDSDGQCQRAWGTYLLQMENSHCRTNGTPVSESHGALSGDSGPTTKGASMPAVPSSPASRVHITADSISNLSRSDAWVDTLVKSVGVPSTVRGKVWLRWSGALAKRRAHRPDYYECLVNQIKEEKV